jgi:multicomponent Na+:H+ antiporter subunit E
MSRRRRILALIRRFAVFALLWMILTEGDLRSPLLSAAFVLAAASASLALKLPSARRWRLWPVFSLAAYFLGQSVLGGMDVARRALAPSMPIEPALVRFELALPVGFSTVLFAWLVSLTPGSAAAHIEGRTLTVHVLDTRMPVERTLRELERRVAAVFASGRREYRR